MKIKLFILLFFLTTPVFAGWRIATVDSIGNVSTSLAIDTSGYPRIAYGDLKYAKWTGSAWSIATAAADIMAGRVSLALDSSGYPRISYYAWPTTNRDLKCAKWNGSSWVSQTPQPLNDVGTDSSLAIDANGKSHISYYDDTNGDLKYTKEENTNTNWPTQTVDSIGNVGRYTEMVGKNWTDF
ncbi:MAG: hypothetical protein WCK75_10860 [Elusimicrobiota bacterium]